MSKTPKHQKMWCLGLRGAAPFPEVVLDVLQVVQQLEAQAQVLQVPLLHGGEAAQHEAARRQQRRPALHGAHLRPATWGRGRPVCGRAGWGVGLFNHQDGGGSTPQLTTHGVSRIPVHYWGGGPVLVSRRTRHEKLGALSLAGLLFELPFSRASCVCCVSCVSCVSQTCRIYSTPPRECLSC